MSDVFEEMMKQYENAGDNNSKKGKKYELSNYFSTFLKKGVNADTRTIRILPPNGDSKTPFDSYWGHKLKVNGDHKTFTCLRSEVMDENGNPSPCPFCELRDELLATGNLADKETAKKYSARKMYVVKVIDRDNEEEGVKFWRFNHNYKKEGNLDKIMGALRVAKHDITDPITGRDLIIDIQRDLTNNIPGPKSINNDLNASVLSENTELVEKWVSDTRTWRDVYSIRDYNYLSIIVDGETPVYDKALEKFVSVEGRDKAKSVTAKQNEIDDDSTELTLGAITLNDNVIKPYETEDVKTNDVVNYQVKSSSVEEDEDDDLPF